MDSLFIDESMVEWMKVKSHTWPTFQKCLCQMIVDLAMHSFSNLLGMFSHI
jgi:hypothetical protein